MLEAAKRLGRPVKWTGDRTEHFLTDAHGRDNTVTAEMAMDEAGRFLALRVDLVANMGAYISQYGPFIPYIGATMSTGVYAIPALDVSIAGVYTNTCPVDAYRGAGRPEAAFLLEKLVDACARDLGIGPEEIRRRNFIRPEQFPYRTPTDRLYDVGEFDGHMTLAMERAGWKSFDKRLAASKAAGKIRGIGMATYIEACAFAGSEPAHVELNGDGTVTLADRDADQRAGPRHRLCAVRRRKAQHRHDRRSGRIRATPTALQMAAAPAVRAPSRWAACRPRAPARHWPRRSARIAADELEASAADIELEGGSARIVGTDRSISFSGIAKAAKQPDDLKGFGEFVQDEATYPNGTHICEVEIDPETGETDDCRLHHRR